MRNLIITAVLLAMAAFSAPQYVMATSPHSVGEMLEYKVTFMGMKIGSIKTFTEVNQSITGDVTHHVRAEIKSEPGIPYVNLDVVYDSWMDPSFAYSHRFRSTEQTDGKKTYQEAVFSYDKKKIFYTKKIDGKVVEDDERQLMKKVNDGTSLLFMARKFLNRSKTVKVPTYIKDENNLTIINFHNRSGDVEIDAADYPVAVKYLDGTAKWKGLYGLSGDFEGWFSDDDAAVPIKAKMNVYIGSVDIELVKWKRSGWKPPRAGGSSEAVNK